MTIPSLPHAVVLGAGPAGISAAHRLLKEGYRVTVVERRGSVGGLGATFQWHDFRLDYGPHAFHPHPSVVMENINAIFGNEDSLIHQNRNERLLLHNKLFQYPIRLWELLLRMNPFNTLRMGFAFLMASFIYRYIAVPDDNFESWCIKRFGRPLYLLVFGNYTNKVWGISPRKISPKFAKQKIKGLNLKDLVKKILGSKGEETIDYWDDLFYPRMGSGQLYDRYRRFLESEGVTFRLQSTPTAFCFSNGRIESVEITGPAGTEQLATNVVVSTIPLSRLVDLSETVLSPFAVYMSRQLRYRALLLIFIEFHVERITPHHWVYLLDAKYKSNRFTEQKNMSPDTCPSDRTAVCFERSCDFDDEAWNASDESLYQRVMKEDVEVNPHIDASKAGRHHVVRIRDAYPIYDLQFDQHLRAVLESLARIPNLYSTGRQGLFLQNGMHQSMEMGWNVGDYAAGRNPQSPWAWYKTILRKWDMD